MRALILAGSLRQDSYNRKLSLVAAKHLETLGHEPSILDAKELELPLYNGDLDGDQKPEPVEALKNRIIQADCLLIASPEYNYSIPGVVKNAIDWVSRFRPMPWKGAKIFLMSTSPGGAGGSRGLFQLQVPLLGLGAYVFPQMFTLPGAMKAFDESGELSDKKMDERLRKNLADFLEYVENLK